MEKLLKNCKVRIRDVAAVERKLKLLSEAGKDKLLIISDFDYTLTRFHDKLGEHCWTTHGVFDIAAATVAPKLAAEFERLKKTYFPIEFDPNMSIAEKTPHMENWWRSSHGYIIEAGFTKNAIETFVRGAKLQMRDGAHKMLLALNRNRVPFVIFSAGVGNIINLFLKQNFGSIPDNTHIISNMMEFGSDDVVIGFSEPLIHTFCKNSNVIKHRESLFKEISSRSSVVLMGDSLGDLKMDVGVENEQVALKIGFLNFNVDSLLDKYMEGYDIVIIDDQTMDVPHMILSTVFTSGDDIDELSDVQNLSTCSSCCLEVNEIDNELKTGENNSSIGITSKVQA